MLWILCRCQWSKLEVINESRFGRPRERKCRGRGEQRSWGEGDTEDCRERNRESKPIESHCDLEVYQIAFEKAMQIFELTKKFPKEEKYSLTDQIRRSSRSVNANLAEAWRKRRYEGAFLIKLSDAEAEAAETQVWLEFAVRCEYLDRVTARDLYRSYNQILGKPVRMINNPSPWLLLKRSNDHRKVKSD